ncbi:SMI1/KNR4 family protein [Rhodococcus sp. NPDC058505]|uniref:SMI1/KNR4 family protein n=1 Tax=Rhodococcus sp. NPDC058505 TaxID=3346531 RepID=UPI003656BCAD
MEDDGRIWRAAFNYGPGRRERAFLQGSSESRPQAIVDALTAIRDFVAAHSGPVDDRATIHVVQYRADTELGRVLGATDPDLPVEELVARTEAAIAAYAREQDEMMRRTEESAALLGDAPTLSPTPPGSVRAQWDRVSSWLDRNLPAATPAGLTATPEAVAAAVTRTGVAWPDELIDFVTAARQDHPHRLFPSHAVLSLDQMLDDHAMMVDIWSEIDADEDGSEPGDGQVVSEQAGTPAFTFIREYVPFAGLDGYYLVVDTRPGPMHGCVLEFSRDGADEVGPRWKSVSAMLTDLADSLESGGVFDRLWYPRITDGDLVWELRD